MAEEVSAPVHLSNNDFRQLLMTPRGSYPSSASESGIHQDASETFAKPKNKRIFSDRAKERLRKKSVYAKMKKEQDEKMAELNNIYRDRAKERRMKERNSNGLEEGYQTINNDYRAVPPDQSKHVLDNRKMSRLETLSENMPMDLTKFLGGDRDHTHLVKGLDFALCKQVKDEIAKQEKEQEEEMEKLFNSKEKEEDVKKKNGAIEAQGNELKFKTSLGRNIHNHLMTMRSKKIEQNQYFVPGRMAYTFDVDEENVWDDVSTTRIRSREEMPICTEPTTLATNHIVITKLIQILSYLRQGNKHGKKNKNKNTNDEAIEATQLKPLKDIGIYDDIGEYTPKFEEKDSNKKESESKKRDSYFSKPARVNMDKENEVNEIPTDLTVGTTNQSSSNGLKTQPLKPVKVANFLLEAEGYSECYPEMEEHHDALYDSDEESNFTNISQALYKKRGPIGRWDFDTTEEYNKFIGKTEAFLKGPKSLNQFGVKKADGRNPNNFNKEKYEKAKLDRQWQQIQNMNSKRTHVHQGNSGPKLKAPKLAIDC